MPAEQQDATFQLVTVDVWDTLIRRLCHPDEVKLAAARFVRLTCHANIRPELRSDRAIFAQRQAAEVRIGNRTRAEGYDDEYELVEVWRETLHALWMEASPPSAELVQAVVRHELEFEQRISYADPGIGTLLAELEQEQGLRILSDFYVSLPALLELVRSKHPKLQFVGDMVSCDQRVNKRTGRLFRRLHRSLGVRPSQHLHIGDNRESDVKAPAELGISTRHYTNPSEDAKGEQLNREFTARQRRDFAPYWERLRQVARSSVDRDPRAGDERFALGAELAPIFVLFVWYVIERAIEAGAERIYYFTREGEILVRVHQAIAEALPHAALPRPELLEVSRLATFGPSLSELSLQELNRFWTMYPRHSMRTLFGSLGVDEAHFRPNLARVKLDLDEVLVEPWTDERFLRLLDDERFTTRLSQRLLDRRKDLAAYLAEHGITPATRQAFVVDIGWRGTIQDNLARTLPQVKWCGVYFALFRFLNSQPSNSSKHAFLFDDNQGDGGERLLSPQAPIEMLFNSSSGSVVGYARDQDGVTRALRHNAQGEDRVHERFTAMLQQGVLAATPQLARSLDRRALSALDLRVFAYRQARALLADPPAAFARAYFELEHNETFGVGGLVKHDLGLREAWSRSHSLSRTWSALAQRPKDSGWPSGLLTAYPIAKLPLLTAKWGQQVRDARRSYKLLGRIGREVWNGSQRRGLVPVLMDVKEALTRTPPRPSNEAARLVDMVGDVDLQDPALRDFNALNTETRASAVGPMVVAWVLPDIGLGSGGHMTLLRFVRHFRSLGIVNRIYIQGRSQHKTKTDLRRFVEAHYGSLEGVEVFTTSHNLHESDILIATHWSTAYEVFRWSKTRFKAYFVQDFEPYFYAKGATGIFAENTYLMNFFGICASPWLHEMTTRQYGMRSCQFYLGYEPDTYFHDPLVERDPNRIAVYMRPTTERRGTELLLAALKRVRKRRPQTRISIFGTSTIPDVGLKAELLGLQNEEQLRRLHSGSAITLLTSLTNYSLLPIEAMACGSVVVDVDVDSMHATFGADAPIVLVRPEPIALADQIIALLDAPERLQELSQRSVGFARQFRWSTAFDSVTTDLFAEYFKGGGSAGLPAKLPRFVRGRGGAQVFVIRNGKRAPIQCMDTLKDLGAELDDVVDIDVRLLLRLPLEESDADDGIPLARELRG